MGTVEGDRVRLGSVFDEVAYLYDLARPKYPNEIFEDLFAFTRLDSYSCFIEVGCGTGQASVPIAQRARGLIGIEPGPNLSEIARWHLDPYPGSFVITQTFESFQPAGAKFDALVAATCWHWIDPNIRYAKAHECLKRSGFLCIFRNTGVLRFNTRAGRYQVSVASSTAG